MSSSREQTPAGLRILSWLFKALAVVVLLVVFFAVMVALRYEG